VHLSRLPSSSSLTFELKSLNPFELIPFSIELTSHVSNYGFFDSNSCKIEACLNEGSRYMVREAIPRAAWAVTWIVVFLYFICEDCC